MLPSNLRNKLIRFRIKVSSRKIMNGSDNSDTISTHSFSLADSLTGDLINNNQTPLSDNATALKYDKVIQDYVKVRSKLAILKKAYVELSEQSSHKDKCLRKNEQEIEGLTFRNQQLASRVESLQKELDQLKASQQVNQTISGLSQAPTTLATSSNILEEELVHKINENANLHKRIHEIELEIEQSNKKSNDLIQAATTQRSNLQKKFDALELQSKSVINKLQNDKIKISINLSEKEKEIKLLKSQNPTQVLSSCYQSDKLNSKVVFINLINQQSKAFERLFFSLGKRGFLTQLDQTNNKSLKVLESLSVTGTAPLSNILLKFESYMTYVFNELKKLPEEDPSGASSSEISSLNLKLKNDLNSLSYLIVDSKSAELQQLEKFTMTAGSMNESPMSLLSQLKNIFNTKQADRENCNKNFRNSIVAIHSALTKISAILNEKLSVEYELGYPQTTTMMDECIVSYLDELNELISELLLMLNNDLGLFDIYKTLMTVTDSGEKDLKETNQIKEANDRIAKLEKDLDASDRLRYKFDQIQAQLVQLQSVEAEQRALILRLETEKLESSQVTTVSEVSDNNIDDSVLKNKFYLKKIAKLNSQVQMLDSKAMFYHDEMKCMLERLKLQIDMNSLLDTNLNEVKDQLERTQSSYEVQMSTMSDHLIEITNRMNRQEEENERLKHDLAVHSSKTGKIKKTK